MRRSLVGAWTQVFLTLSLREIQIAALFLALPSLFLLAYWLSFGSSTT